jgi:uncharacterized membrane protein
MEAVESSTIINVPAATAYERWQRWEDFPQFMEGLTEVQRLDDTHFAWKWELHGHKKESVSEITLQIPNQRIAWRSISGAENSGVVSFEPVDETKTKISLSFKYTKEGEWDTVEALSARLRNNLAGFKKLIEGSAIEDIVENNWQGF